MNTVEKVISTTFDEIENITINVNEKTGLKVKMDGKTYEFIVNLVEYDDTILVFSPPFLNKKKSSESVNKPVFFDELKTPLNHNTIYYNDPTRYDFKQLNSGWGVGTRDIWHLENIAKIIKKIAYLISDYNVMSIKEYSNIFIYGKSMGGFMSIILSVLIKNSTSISDNPQTNLFNHSYFKNISQYCFKNLTPNQIQKYSYKLNIIDLIQKEQYIPNSYINIDSTNKKQWETQFADFLTSLNNLPYATNNRNNNIKINFDGFIDANKLVSEYKTIDEIENIILIENKKNLENFIKYHMLDEFNRNLNQLHQDYDEESISYEKFIQNSEDFIDKWSNSRVDIKNHGSTDNSIEILEQNEDIQITFPSWYNNDEGMGCSIISSSGKISLKFKCKNDGILNMHLRGPNFIDYNKSKHPIYVCYDKLIINEEIIFSKEFLVWHNKPFNYTQECKDGEIINLEIEVSTLNTYFPIINELIHNLSKDEFDVSRQYDILKNYLNDLITINNPLY